MILTMDTNDQVGRNEPCPCGSGKKFKVCCEGRQGIVQEARRSPWMIGGLAVVGLAVVATVALQLGGEPAPTEVSRSFSPPAPLPAPIVSTAGSSAPITLQPLDQGTPVPQPPGPAPDGKVWSAEHGHYHDAPGAVAQGPTATSGAIPFAPQPVSPGTLTPEPEGPAPEGKVWSPEHGHYHDVPGAAPQITTEAGRGINLGPQPVDPGALAPQPITPPAPTPQPDGPVPAGKVWSTEHGHWHDAPPPAPPGPK